MKETPQIDIIIPTYNREKTIERAVRSVLGQTYDNIKVIIVDDGSTDGTEQIINSIEDSRIRYYKLKKTGAQDMPEMKG